VSSEFQKRKVAGVFYALDADQDGYLEEEDFQCLTDRWNQIRGYQPGTPEHERMTAVMMGWWQALLAASDLDRDNRVTLDEVMLVVDQLPHVRDQVLATAHSMFEAVDENGNGEVSPAEYNQMITAWKGYDVDTDGAFRFLDANGDGHLSREEFADLWADFWIGDDQASPSKWVFGPF
jgi:Ca2+-binding EF-hand superfamily protein